MMNWKSYLWMIFSALALISCSKDKEFKAYYGGSGIWEINSLKVDYQDATGHTDSIRTYPDCGMFIFYNVDIGAENKEYNGQIGITTFTEIHHGCAWYPEDDKLYIKLQAASPSVRVYEVSGSKDEQTWHFSGPNNGFLPGNAPNVDETLTVKRIKTKS